MTGGPTRPTVEGMNTHQTGSNNHLPQTKPTAPTAAHATTSAAKAASHVRKALVAAGATLAVVFTLTACDVSSADSGPPRSTPTPTPTPDPTPTPTPTPSPTPSPTPAPTPAPTPDGWVPPELVGLWNGGPGDSSDWYLGISADGAWKLTNDYLGLRTPATSTPAATSSRCRTQPETPRSQTPQASPAATGRSSAWLASPSCTSVKEISARSAHGSRQTEAPHRSADPGPSPAGG
jgi:hypothetical protein